MLSANNELIRDGEDNFHSQLVKNEVINSKSDSSGNGSGSESSLSEIWTVRVSFFLFEKSFYRTLIFIFYDS